MRERVVDGRRVFLLQMRDDRIAVADGPLFIDEIRQLRARCRFGIENMPVLERQPAQPQKREDLLSIGVVVFDAIQAGVRIERDHEALPAMRRAPGKAPDRSCQCRRNRARGGRAGGDVRQRRGRQFLR
jgi:hypothetical protein